MSRLDISNFLFVFFHIRTFVKSRPAAFSEVLCSTNFSIFKSAVFV